MMRVTHLFAFALLALTGAIALFLAGVIFLTGLLFHFLPELSRHEIFFAVTVDPSYRKTEEAKLILRHFRVAIWIHTLIALGGALAGIATRHLLILLTGIFWQIGGATIAFLRARRQVLAHAVAQSSHREAALVRRSPGAIYWLLQIGPFAILAARAVYLRAHWQSIPPRFPVHWGLNGEPNGWSTRSFTGVYGPVLIGFTVCLFVALFSYGVVHWTRHIRSTGPEAAAETRFRQVQLGLLLAVSYFMSWIFGGVPFMALRQHPGQAPSIAPFLLGTFAFVAVLYAILIHSGQGGANLMKASSESDILGAGSVTGDRTTDQCWKAGMFYVNHDDPALLVEKRFGIGYTLNFGRPGSWLLAAAILAVAVVPLVIALLSVH
jgi:uncharacterized membrane protein